MAYFWPANRFTGVDRNFFSDAHLRIFCSFDWQRPFSGIPTFVALDNSTFPTAIIESVPELESGVSVDPPSTLFPNCLPFLSVILPVVFVLATLLLLLCRSPLLNALLRSPIEMLLLAPKTPLAFVIVSLGFDRGVSRTESYSVLGCAMSNFDIRIWTRFRLVSFCMIGFWRRSRTESDDGILSNMSSRTESSFELGAISHLRNSTRSRHLKI